MKDTTREMEDRYRALLLSKSNAERFRMGCEMFTAAKALAAAGLLSEGSGGLRRRLFLRLYGNDFSRRERDRILLRIEEWEAGR